MLRHQTAANTCGPPPQASTPAFGPFARGKWRGGGSRQWQRRRRQVVLDELTRAGGLSARELSERLEIGSRTLERDLAVLRDAGLVFREGPPKTSIYRPVKAE